MPLWFSLITLTLLLPLGQTASDWPQHSTISHAGLPNAASGLWWLVAVMFVGKSIGPGPNALSAHGLLQAGRYSILWERCFSQAWMKFYAFKAGCSQARLAFIFVVPSIISTQLAFKDNDVEKQ